MRAKFDAFERFLVERGTTVSILLGLGAGILLGGLALLIGGVPGLIVAIVAYLPFYARITVSCFAVAVHEPSRSRLVGGDVDPFRAFFLRMYSPFGLFCAGWGIAYVAIGVSMGALDLT